MCNDALIFRLERSTNSFYFLEFYPGIHLLTLSPSPGFSPPLHFLPLLLPLLFLSFFFPTSIHRFPRCRLSPSLPPSLLPPFLSHRPPNKRSLQVSYLIKLRETAGNEFRYPDAFRPRKRDTSPWPSSWREFPPSWHVARRSTLRSWLKRSQWSESTLGRTPSIRRAALRK